MAIKTDAMIAHNGAVGYTLHIDYDPDTDDFELKAVFNDGTEKSISGDMGGGSEIDALIDRSITSVQSDAGSVGESVFRGCNNLLTVDLPNAEAIGSSAFYKCSSLQTVNMPKATSLGSSVFYQCPAIRNLDLPKVTAVASSAFYQSTALKSVLLPEISTVGANAFSGCSGLKYVYLGPNASSIPGTAFSSTTQSDLVIDCGFSAGAVSGAPWGATHATINYDVPAPNPPAGI